MRPLSALIIALGLGAAANCYTPAAKAAGVYVGLGAPAPVVVGVHYAAPLAPYYYAPRVWWGPGIVGPRYLAYGRYYGWHHGYWGHRWR